MEGSGDKPNIHDREAGALGLFLGLLHIVSVLRYAGVVGLPCGHGRVEVDNIPGLSATTAGSYIGEELAGSYLRVEGFGVAEAAYPNVLTDRNNKLAGELLCPLNFIGVTYWL